MKWSILSGDVNWETYGGKLVAGPFQNGDFAYWYVIEVLEWAEAVGEREAADIDGTHNVCLSVVAPSECSAKELDSAMRSWDWDSEDDTFDRPLALVELLHEYGVCATVWDASGGLRSLLHDAKQEAILVKCFFGTRMDAPQNAIGSTGWDLLRGDITAGLQLAR